MSVFETPLISKGIREIAPDFRAVSIHVDASRASQGEADPCVLTEACAFVLAGGPAWTEAHLASWAETYARFGAKPNRTPCSAQALRKRLLKDGVLPAINPVVDLYNAISLRYAIPVGGENFDAYVGRPQLVVANGTEPFDTMADSKAIIQYPTPGEVVWRDDLGVTCRQWNWRQCSRTRLDVAGGRMWFILESLGTMPQDALNEAGEVFVDGLLRLVPGAIIDRRQVSFNEA